MNFRGTVTTPAGGTRNVTRASAASIGRPIASAVRLTRSDRAAPATSG